MLLFFCASSVQLKAAVSWLAVDSMKKIRCESGEKIIFLRDLFDFHASQLFCGMNRIRELYTV